MSEGVVVLLAALIGAVAVVAGSLIGLVMQQRLLDRQLVDRKAERTQERRFEIYRESLTLLLSLPSLIEEGVTAADMAEARRKIGASFYRMRAGLMVTGGKKVREASNRARDAFAEFTRLADERGKKNLELPLEQRESIFDIYERTFQETMEEPIMELGKAMREEMGVED